MAVVAGLRTTEASGRLRGAASPGTSPAATVAPPSRRSTVRLLAHVAAVGVVQAFAIGWVLHRLHDDPAEAHEAVYVPPVLHWLRDSALAVPGGVLLLLGATLLARRLCRRRGSDGAGAGAGAGAHLLWAGLGSVAYAEASVPAALVHARLFEAGHDEGSFALHSAVEGIVTLRYSFVLLLLLAVVAGLPWTGRSRGRGRRRPQAPPLHRSPTTAPEGR